MKYVLIVPDGMADEPIAELGGRTPMMAAGTPELDGIARLGMVGRVRTIPNGLSPGSDVAALSIMGYDPRRFYTGRAPLEAANLGIELEARDVAFRCNLITTDGERVIDYSAGEISTEEAGELIRFLDERLGSSRRKFYPGISYRHILLWRRGSVDLKSYPPHDILDQDIESHLPQGDNEDELRRMMWDSFELLDRHPLNMRRVDAGKRPANMIWLWGQGHQPALPKFTERRGISGTVISAVDLIRGIARLAGLRAPAVPGATGRIDTNWRGKAQAAIEAIRRDDFVMIHVEAPDECGHQGDLEGKIRSIELADSVIIGPVWAEAKSLGEARILVLPDHYTPISRRTHTGIPVPFALCGSGIPADGIDRLDEAIAAESPVMVDEGFTLIDRLLG